MVQQKSFGKILRKHFSRSVLQSKGSEAIASVLPMTLIVLCLCSTVVSVPTDAMLGFLFGAVLLTVGMMLFNLGTDTAMTPMGEEVGSAITRTRRLWIVLAISFLVGIIVTVSEPDLQVLAQQVPGVPNLTLILAVAIGVGLFLMLAMLRILFRIRISILLLICYIAVFVLSAFVPKNFLAVAFDAGGVTTGPMTVPFILALGVGVSAIRADPGAENDSFGLVALSSVGPILAVMILSLVFQTGEGTQTAISTPTAEDTRGLMGLFAQAFPEYVKEMGIALLPILVFFLGTQLTLLKLSMRELIPILTGIFYTWLGLSLFLTGVNVGFLPMGYYLGEAIAESPFRWALIPLGGLIGWFTVSAEPAVHVLSRQVYEISAGAIPKKALKISLSAGVAVSVALSMLRILTHLPILYFLIPGYGVALILMKFVPPMFTSIAFDSGGVASGPMTATFLLPMAMGACAVLGGEDAFGVVAMVAMTPLIAIQLLGLVRMKKQDVSVEKSKKPEELREEIIE